MHTLKRELEEGILCTYYPSSSHERAFVLVHDAIAPRLTPGNLLHENRSGSWAFEIAPSDFPGSSQRPQKRRLLGASGALQVIFSGVSGAFLWRSDWFSGRFYKITEFQGRFNIMKRPETPCNPMNRPRGL